MNEELAMNVMTEVVENGTVQAGDVAENVAAPVVEEAVSNSNACAVAFGLGAATAAGVAAGIWLAPKLVRAIRTKIEEHKAKKAKKADQPQEKGKKGYSTVPERDSVPQNNEANSEGGENPEEEDE